MRPSSTSTCRALLVPARSVATRPARHARGGRCPGPPRVGLLLGLEPLQSGPEPLPCRIPARSRSLSRALSLALSRALARSPARPRSLSRALSLALAPSRSLSRALSLALSRALARSLAHSRCHLVCSSSVPRPAAFCSLSVGWHARRAHVFWPASDGRIVQRLRSGPRARGWTRS